MPGAPARVAATSPVAVTTSEAAQVPLPGVSVQVTISVIQTGYPAGLRAGIEMERHRAALEASGGLMTAERLSL
jgi:hypothetical protein